MKNDNTGKSWPEQAESLIADHLEQQTHLQDKVATLRILETDAMGSLSDINERLSAGDTSVEAQELMLAEATARRATKLLASAELETKRHALAAPVAPSLAVELAAPLSATLRVPVSVVQKVPEQAPKGLPAAFLIQVERTEHDIHDGVLRGAVQLVYMHSDLHLPLDCERIEQKLKELGIGVAVNPRSREQFADGIELQSLQLSVSSLFPELPVIAGGADLEPFRVPIVWQVIASRVENNSYIGGRATVGARSSGQVVRATASQGRRVVEIEATIDAWAVDRMWELREVLSRINQSVDKSVGMCFAGAGRVTRAEVLSTSATGHGHVEAEVRITVESLIAS